MMAIPVPEKESRHAVTTGPCREICRPEDRSAALRHCAHVTLTLQVAPTVLLHSTPLLLHEQEEDGLLPTTVWQDPSTHYAKASPHIRARARSVSRVDVYRSR